MFGKRMSLGVLALSSACANGAHGGGDGHDAEGGSVASDDDGGSGETTDGYEPDGELADPDALGPQGLRRLSLAELATTIELITKMERIEIETLLAVLPGDGSTPFDNDYAEQTPSAPLVEGMLSIAEAVSDRVTSDPALRDELLGCVPTGPDDEACLRTFAQRFGRIVLRRPLASEEVDELAAFISYAEQDGEFDTAVRLVIQALFLDARFLYRVEIGEPVAGEPDLVRLDDFEMASRLAFLLWGSGPDDALLDLAEAGELASSGQVHAAAKELVRDRRGLAQIQRMHAMWLGYATMALDPALASSLRRETDELLERVLVDGNWLGAFTAEETWLDDRLADHYGIALPGGTAGWVEYPDIRRRGLLSHGTLLSIGAKFGDTSPTERGKAVWTRLLCNEIPPPPPEVDSGLPPSGGSADACKTERYDMRTKAECASCHGILDSIGFGLENYGPAGEWRTVEPDKPDCSIAGEGELASAGAFAGAGSLGEMLVETGMLEGCFVRHTVQFAIGRRTDDRDQPMLDALTASFEAEDDAVRVLLELAASEGFRHRRADEGP
jgi:hypothetical protein